MRYPPGSTLLLLLAALASSPARANVSCNTACQDLLGQGNSLMLQGDGQGAYDKFMAAKQADPTSSAPVASLANLMSQVASSSSGADAAKARNQAEALAHQALGIDANDPQAQELLRKLSEDGATALHQPKPAALALNAEGDALFFAKRYDEALAKFRAASAADPAWSTPLVFSGDCFYARGRWAEAEAQFRRATEIEPLNGQAWRFLSDALLQQGKRAAARTALVSGLAAHPGQLPSWSKLASIMAADGVKLQTLQLRPRASYRKHPETGKPEVTLEQSLVASADKPAFAFWTVYAMGLALTDGPAPDNKALAPFQRELLAWRRGLDALKEAGDRPQDAALRTMQTLDADGQLEPALLLLAYRENYRPQLEAWKAAHPNGVQQFIERYRLRP